MFNKEELDKWFQEKFYKDYSKHRPNHIDTLGHDPNIKLTDHPMCRCSIIPIEAKAMIFMPYISKALVKEYVEECKEAAIWRN